MQIEIEIETGCVALLVKLVGKRAGKRLWIVGDIGMSDQLGLGCCRGWDMKGLGK
jgi:hypothetical protein